MYITFCQFVCVIFTQQIYLKQCKKHNLNIDNIKRILSYGNSDIDSTLTVCKEL